MSDTAKMEEISEAGMAFKPGKGSLKMETVKIADKGHTQLIAHRGLSGIEPENTVNAFAAACSRSYFGVECDIHRTADGKYLVYHDDCTGRLCDRDLSLEQSDFASLRALKIRRGGENSFDESLRIPTLEEYLAVLAPCGKTAVIELKNPMDQKSVREIVEICKVRFDLGKIIFISFDLQNLVYLRELLPQSPLQLLTAELPENLLGTLKEHRLDLDIGHWLLTEETVRHFQEHGIAVNCWTCDDPEWARQLITWGVDYITTDILE